MSSLDPALGVFIFGIALAYGYAFVGGFTDAANAIATELAAFQYPPAAAKSVMLLVVVVILVSVLLRFVDIRQILGRIGLQRLQEDAVPGDLALGLAVGRAGDAEADRQRGAVARQADDANIVAEILAAELRADA